MEEGDGGTCLYLKFSGWVIALSQDQLRKPGVYAAPTSNQLLTTKTSLWQGSAERDLFYTQPPEPLILRDNLRGRDGDWMAISPSLHKTCSSLGLTVFGYKTGRRVEASLASHLTNHTEKYSTCLKLHNRATWDSTSNCYCWNLWLEPLIHVVFRYLSCISSYFVLFD